MNPNVPAMMRNSRSSWKRKRRMGTNFPFAGLLSTAFLLLSLRTTHSQSEVDPCFQALYDADTNADQRIDLNEYGLFIQLLQPDATTSSEFASLPLSVQGAFYTLACACRESESFDCCLEDNAHLSINGTNPNETPTETQLNSLVRICYLVEDSMGQTPTLAPSPAAVLTTQAPSMGQALLPSPTGKNRPTAAPTVNVEIQSSTSPPTFRDEAITKVQVSYTIVVRNGVVDESDYPTDLITALDDLVQQLSNRRRLRKRRLQTILLPTVIESISDKGGFTMTPSLVDDMYYDGVGPCPADLGNPDTDLCQEVVALIKIVVVGLVNPEMARYDFERAVNTAIMDGDLEQSLQRTSPDSMATVLTGQATSLRHGTTTPAPASVQGSDEGGLSTGATAGIVVSACAVFGLLGFLFVARPRPQGKRRRRVLKRLDLDLKSSNQTIPCDLNRADSIENAVTYGRSESLESTEGAVKEITEQALPRSPLVNTQPVSDTSIASDTMVAQPNGDRNDITSYDPVITLPSKESTCSGSKDSEPSAQSDSGWSTDDDHSSMGTADSESFKSAKDFDDKVDNIFDWKNIEISQMNHDLDGSQRSVVMSAATSVKNLENAIMIGDWAAVGASAAALISGAMDTESDHGDVSTDADGSYLSGSLGLSLVEEWKSRETSGKSWQTASDVNKATQLDQLIEKGDWEAVIQAAARFEAEQQHGEASTIGYQPSATSISIPDDAKSMEQHQPPMTTHAPVIPVKESSFRSQVLELVQQVVPGELANIDDMLEEFEGREEDLIETLKAMKTQHQPQGGTPPKKKRNSPREHLNGD